MRILLFIPLFLSLFACGNKQDQGPAEESFDLEAIKSYIVAMEDTLAMAYAKKDHHLFQKFYAENAVTYGEGREQLFGKQQIVNHFKNTVAADTVRNYNFKYTTIDVFSTSKDMAVESGRWTEYDDAGNEIDHGFYMVLFQEVNGRLVSTRDMWNSAISN